MFVTVKIEKSLTPFHYSFHFLVDNLSNEIFSISYPGPTNLSVYKDLPWVVPYNRVFPLGYNFGLF